MKTEKIVLKLLSIILIAVFAITTSSMNLTSIAKTTSVNLDLKIQYKRYSNETEGKAYAYNSTEGKHPFFQILEGDNGSSSKGYYCLNAIVSNTWNQQGTISAGQSVNYNNSYDMRTELEEIKTSQDSNYQKLAKSEHIQEIMWILKNMYVPTGNKNTDDAQREALLSNAGIIYSDIEVNHLEDFYGSGEPTIEHAYKYVPQAGYDDYVTTRAAGLSESSQVKTGWYYFAKDTSEFTSVSLPDELIEVAEQAAIWYYTNYLDDTSYAHREQFNVKEKGLQLLCSEDGSGLYTSWQPLINQFQLETDADRVNANTGSWMQDQATILCWYLIDAAEKNATTSSGASDEVPLKVSVPVNGQNVSSMTINTVNSENYYVLGPIKVDKILEESYTLSDTIKVNGKDCTEYKVLSNKTDTTSSNSTISDEVGKEVYLGIPLSWIKQNNASKETEQNDMELEITFSGTYKTNAITLYESSTNGEQPIVKVEPKNQPFELKVKGVDPKKVDLALTKFITAISKDATIEDGEYLTADKKVGSNTNPYLRATSVNTTNLKNDPTCHDATYTMVKTPLTVPAQSYVLYNIRVYNEGGVDVYAGEVKDHLPSYLEFVSGSEINTRYGWSLDTDGVTVKTNYLEYKAGETTHLLKAFDKAGDNGAGSGLDYEDLPILCRVKETAPEETNIVNTAEVSKYQDKTGTTLPNDIDSQPNNRQNKNTESREQDDDDWEVVKVGPTVDLALTKFITAVSKDATIEDGEYLTADKHVGSNTNPYLRATSVNTTNLKNDPTCHDATYTMVKTPLTVPAQSYVLYNIRVYNEGQTDLYAGEVKDHLPSYLEFVPGSEINTRYGWSLDSDGVTVKTNYLEYKEGQTTHLLKAFDKAGDNGAGSGLDYEDLQILCRVKETAPRDTNIVNTAEVSKYQDKTGTTLPEDVDSQPNNRQNKNTESREQDDDDWEVVKVEPAVDLALTKFIIAISKDATIEDGEYLTADKHIGSNTNPYLRATSVNTTNLKNDPTCHDATYTMVKTPLTVPERSYVLYNIRVYNEGGVDVYAGEVKDHLPEYLDYVYCDFNDNFGWELSEDGKTITTKYLEYKAGETTHLLKAFDKAGDNGAGSGLDYEDLPILCRVKETAPEETNIVNTAEVSKYQDKTGTTLPEDIDSQPNNRQNKNTESREQDDDDWEVVKVESNVDLALKKFIIAVSNDTTIEDGEYLTANGKIGSNTNPYLRATSVDTKDLRDDPICHDATYNMVKDPLTVPAQSYVLYNIRVYNEGEVDVYAGEVKDHLPEYLDYVYCDFNDNFGWELSEDGKTISTKYLEYKENDDTHLLKAFDKTGDNGAGSGLDYEDLQVLCRVNDKTPTNTEIVNVAEVSKYQDDEGKDITEDVDSTPDNVNDKEEDDDDFERVIIKTFDLSLLKWVSTVYVTEDGKTKTTQTGNTGDDSKDIIPKVEINKKKIDSTIVRFGYTIKVTNEGDVEGYVKEITDYVPEGLKFYSEDNTGWTDEGNNVISTRLLENTLLKPGESAEVTVILRWINGSNNLNLKTNIAEISEDYNDEGIPDRDSTPDNKKNGEDDIDDASVLLAISTGSSMNVLKITLITTVCLGTVIIFIVGFNVIRKYIL